MMESPQNQPEHEVHFNPDPKDTDYMERVMENAAEDSREGENNPNYTSKPN
jgi:hypothetical protein